MQLCSNLFLPILFSSFDADPAFIWFDVDDDGGEAGIAEDVFEFFWCRVVEVIVFYVFPSGNQHRDHYVRVFSKDVLTVHPMVMREMNAWF